MLRGYKTQVDRPLIPKTQVCTCVAKNNNQNRVDADSPKRQH